MGVVPQRERRPRTIVDYSFSGINQEAAQGAPAEAMQFGKALNHILQRILAANPWYGPTYMLKLDLSDGFSRIRLHAKDIPMTEFRQPLQVQSHLEMPRILVQLGHIQRT